MLKKLSLSEPWLVEMFDTGRAGMVYTPVQWCLGKSRSIYAKSDGTTLHRGSLEIWTFLGPDKRDNMIGYYANWANLDDRVNTAPRVVPVPLASIEKHWLSRIPWQVSGDLTLFNRHSPHPKLCFFCHYREGHSHVTHRISPPTYKIKNFSEQTDFLTRFNVIPSHIIR